MKKNIFVYVLAAFFIAGCSSQHTHSKEEVPRNHDNEAEHEHGKHNHEHEEIKTTITAYNNIFEVFAETSPFVTDENVNVLAHFTNLSDFSPLKSGNINIQLTVNGKTIKILNKPVEKGMCNFTIEPETSGSGELIFLVENGLKSDTIIANITVYEHDEDAHEAIEKADQNKTNTTVFTKEQSWKIDFATALPEIEPFGQVIKTTAQVQPAPNDAQVVTSKTSGIVLFGNTSVLPGNKISKGQNLFAISGSSLANDNSTVKFLEAKNNFEKAKLDYERIQGLAEDRIVTKAELLEAKNNFENAEAIYTNLKNNFSASGQTVKSPVNGFIQHLYVQNGEYVEAGQALAVVSQNKNLMLYAEVQSKYAGDLAFLKSANIATSNQQRTYSLDELNGKIISWGKSANHDNYLIPVNIQIEDNGEFYPGNFVKTYLKTTSDKQALTVPGSALIEEQGVYYVFVQKTPELFEKREVKPGASDGIKTQILAGLNTNERIVTRGAVSVKLSQASGALDPHAGHVH